MFKPETRILTVDDVAAMREFVAMALRQLGFSDIKQAKNGREGLNILMEQNLSGRPFELIISDWNMPDINGLEFLKEVRRLDFGKSVPFILLTAENEKSMVMDAVLSGVSNYIIKPFNAKILEEKLKAVWLKTNNPGRK